MKLLIFILLTSVFMGCSSTPNFKISKDSVKPSTEIDWLGNKTALLGQGKLKTGNLFPEIDIINESMKVESIYKKGKVSIISTIPSIDTEVCDQQTHILSESKKLNPGIERITISRDLPYALRRFSENSDLKNIRYFSDYKNRQFGTITGLEIERNRLLARAIIVIDKDGVVRHLQITPEIYALPNMDKAISIANELEAKK